MGQRNHLGIEGIGIHNDFLQVTLWNLTSHKGLDGLIGYISEGRFASFVQNARTESWYFHWYVESACGSIHSVDNSSFKINLY